MRYPRAPTHGAPNGCLPLGLEMKKAANRAASFFNDRTQCIVDFFDFAVAELALALMQFIPSEHHPPFPFIRFAEAVDEKIGAGSDKIRAVRATEAIAESIHFIVNSFPPTRALTASETR
jgi:hypothetical protein